MHVPVSMQGLAEALRENTARLGTDAGRSAAETYPDSKYAAGVRKIPGPGAS